MPGFPCPAIAGPGARSGRRRPRRRGLLSATAALIAVTAAGCASTQGPAAAANVAVTPAAEARAVLDRAEPVLAAISAKPALTRVATLRQATVATVS